MTKTAALLLGAALLTIARPLAADPAPATPDVQPGADANSANPAADAMFKEHAREANVIAAAPDLYAALYRLLDVVYDKKGDDREQAIQHALAVMEKARGGENE